MDRFELVSRKLMERNLYREHIPDGEYPFPDAVSTAGRDNSKRNSKIAV